jgi:uncharacterized protein DUF6492
MSNDPGARRPTYAIITPSYALDFERCRLLVESVRALVAPHVEHYVIVDRRDEGLFQQLRGPRTHVVVKQSILPWWLHQVPSSTRWWVSLKGLPVRGWIVQQIVKLSVDAVTRADVCIFMDSDTLLIKPFDPRAAERAGAVPLFRELLPAADAHNTKWHAAAERLLGLVPEPDPRASYVTQAVTWRRSNLIALKRQIESTTRRGWVESLCALPTMSEYVVYGVFCERLLRERSGHYVDGTITTLNYWETTRLEERDLAALRARLRPEHVGVMISAKSSTEVGAIRRAFVDR